MEDARARLQHPEGLYWWLWYVNVVTRVLWVTLNNFYCIPVYFVALALLSPLLLVDSKRYWRYEGHLYDTLLAMVACWSHTAGFEVYESGDRLDDVLDSNFLFMPNHQSTADVPLCMTLFSARKRCHAVMWIMDYVFKFTNFGWVAAMHWDFFILAGKKYRDQSLIELRRHLAEIFVQKERKYLVLFPEGGFLRKRQAVSMEFAKKNDLPHLEYCTLPRTGALEIALDVLGPKKCENGTNGSLSHGSADSTANDFGSGGIPHRINKIVDVTIAYPEGKPLDLQSIVLAWRKPCITHVHYRVFDVKDIPSEPADLRQWMYNLYHEKDKLLAEYYETGHFPFKGHKGHGHSEGQPPLEVRHDALRFLGLHAAYLSATYLSYVLFSPLLWPVLSLVW